MNVLRSTRLQRKLNGLKFSLPKFNFNVKFIKKKIGAMRQTRIIGRTCYNFPLESRCRFRSSVKIVYLQHIDRRFANNDVTTMTAAVTKYYTVLCIELERWIAFAVIRPPDISLELSC